jgi:uncharacterized protein (TIGR02231 family)
MPTGIVAPIAEVTVYADRARILRRGSVRLAPGEHTLELADIPTSLLEDSVRTGGRGANARILGVEVTRQFVTEPPEAELATLKNQLQDLQDQDAALVDQEKAEAARLEFLGSLRNSSSATLPRGIAYGKASLDEVVAFSQFLTVEMNAALTRQREIAQERRELAKEIAALQGKLAPRWDAPERRQIHVLVETAEETDLELEVEYAAIGASWEPLYDVRLVEDKVTVTYLANVRQQTGEDWPEVRLSLSTARPAVSTTIPELRPWYVDQYKPPVHHPMMMAASAPMAGHVPKRDARSHDESDMFVAMEAPALPPVAEVAQAEIESAGASVTYRVARPVAVPSDGSPHKTTVTTLDLEARLDYVTVPKIAEEAYLRARIKNASELILLPGSANIFHGADFIGTTRLKTIVPNEEFEAQLGLDDRVKVKRELTARATGKTLIGNTRRTTAGYKITLTNHLERPARVTVFDQLPVSRHEQIKARLQEVSPDPAEHNDLNIIKWELELAPQQKRDITFAFVIEHPREMQVTGVSL